MRKCVQCDSPAELIASWIVHAPMADSKFDIELGDGRIGQTMPLCSACMRRIWAKWGSVIADSFMVSDLNEK